MMIDIAKQAISKGIMPILLSSSLGCTNQYLSKIDSSKIMIYQFQ